MQIDEYVKNTRRFKHEPTAAMGYERLYRSICRRAGVLPSDAPLLQVTYTTRRSCETLELEGKTYIVHDQYMGQGMNMLNRIYLNSTSKTDAEMFAYKLLAEELLASGYPGLAIMSTLSYLKLKEEVDSYKHDVDFRKRSRFTEVQECFVLAHELAHVMFSRGEGFASLVRAKRGLLRNEFNTKTDMSELVDKFLSDMHAAFQMDGSYQDHMSQKQISRFQKQFEQNSASLLEGFNMIGSRDDIIEECLCDEWATFITVGIMAEDYNVRLTDSLVGILLGLYHLRLMAIVANEARLLVSANGNDFENYLPGSLVRTSSWRGAVLQTLLVKHPRYSRQMHSMFVSANRRYAEIIQDRVLFVFSRRIKTLKQLFRGQDAPLMLPQVEIQKIIEGL